MKKFFALSLALTLVLSMAAMAAAADFSYSMGGRFYGYFSSIDGDRGFNPGAGNDCWDTILAGTVKQGNTWATIKFIADSWNQKIYHSFGIDNIAGTPWSLGFDSHDSGTANIGQQFMGDLFNDFKADPYFNTCDMAGSINAKYITDSFELRAEAKVYDEDGSTGYIGYYRVGKEKIEDFDQVKNECYTLVLVKKADGGKFYIGGKHVASLDDPLLVAGANFTLSDGIDFKVDFWSDKSGISNQGELKDLLWKNGGHQTLQATIMVDKLTGQFVYSKPEADLDDVFGVGAAYKLTEKFTLGAKYFSGDEDLVEDGLYDVFGMYNLGAWDFKVGVSNAQFKYGQGGNYNAGSSGGDQAAVYNDDGFLYAGVHFEF